MRKFIIRILLFSLLILFVTLIGFILPVTPRSSKSLFYSKIRKDSLLKNVNEPRIIFVGGSNLSFGLDSKTIKDSLKLYPINTAIVLGIGLLYMMDNTIRYTKKGDIIILAPEYHFFYGRLVYGGRGLLRVIADIDVLELLDLKADQLKNIYGYFMRYSFSKFVLTEYLFFKESDIRSVNSFNQYGDAYAHWKMQQRKVWPADSIEGMYNPNTIKLIDKFRFELEKKEARLFITYPPFQATSYDRIINQIKRVEKELKDNDFELLGTSERYRIPDTMMFDSYYHLLKNGVDYRTQLLIADFKKAQVHKNIYN